MITIINALQSLRPGAEWVVREGELEWLDKIQSKPTEAQIDAEIVRLQAEYDSKEYQRLRAAEYPSIQEQMDMQYWDSVNGTTTWQDAIDAVKAKYPKPEGV
jgi:predicted lipoprotein